MPAYTTEELCGVLKKKCICEFLRYVHITDGYQVLLVIPKVLV
jgi:hypothetical protein